MYLWIIIIDDAIAAKSIAATNPLDTILEKSYIEDDNTEVEEEMKKYFAELEKETSF